MHVKELAPTCLTITPWAWSKIIYMRDRDKSEVSGFGISHPDDPLYIVDFKLVPQVNTGTFTEFLDKALANYLEDMVVSGTPPACCMRIWMHTHPGMGPSPSSHDEATFKRVNEASSWGVMLVVANDKEYARLIVHNVEGMEGDRELKVVLALDEVFKGVTAEDYTAWEDEYCENVTFGTAPSVAEMYAYPQCGHWRGWEGSGWEGDAWEDGLIGPPEEGINGEVVYCMKHEDDGYFYVYTDKFWFQFSHEKEVVCDAGQTLVKVSDISGFDAHQWGDLIWNGPDPILFYRNGDEHELSYRLEEEIELAEAVESEEELHEEDTDPEPGHPAEGHRGPREAG